MDASNINVGYSQVPQSSAAALPPHEVVSVKRLPQQGRSNFPISLSLKPRLKKMARPHGE
jgi:hypothetical protein